MEFFKRILNLFICLCNSPKYCVIVLYYRLLKKVPNKLSLNILSPKDTLNVLKTTNKSLIRIGDGEIQLLLGLHGFVNKRDEFIDKVGGRSGSIRNIKILLPYIIKKDRLYGDALTFYAYAKKDNYHKALELVKGKNVLIITHKLLFEKILKKNVFSIADNIDCFCTPEKNSYEFLISNFDILLLKLKNIDNVRILLGAGPGSKIIGYKLVKLNYICYDVGNWLNSVVGDRELKLSNLENY
jgi:hypothetical protein